jgi:hypothetical protein
MGGGAPAGAGAGDRIVGTSEEEMGIQEALRLIAGSFVLVSVALGYFVHPAWFLFTAFVALNLIQSAFSRACPMMWILRRAGVREP